MFRFFGRFCVFEVLQMVFVVTWAQKLGMITCSDRLPPQVDGVEPALVVHFDHLYSKKVPIVGLVSL